MSLKKDLPKKGQFPVVGTNGEQLNIERTAAKQTFGLKYNPLTGE